MNNTPKFITICSGKGGVGKSFVASNLAKLISENHKVLLWDSNSNFPNLHLMLGVDPTIRLDDYKKNNVNFKEVIFKVDDNLDLIIDSPLSDRSEDSRNEKIYDIYKEILALNRYDFVIIDTIPGADSTVLEACVLSDMNILMITDEPTSIVDSYGLLKLLLPFVDKDKIGILVNNVIDEEDFDEIITKIDITTSKFLKKKFQSFGFIPYDREVRKSIQQQELIVDNKNNMLIIENLHDICLKVLNHFSSINLIEENR